MLLIRAFYARDYSTVEKIASSLQAIKSEDPNNEHKLLLLLARTSAVRDQQDRAKFYYQQLGSHPLFKTEAREYLR